MENLGIDTVVAVDETLILHDTNGIQKWLIGAIDTTIKKVRLGLLPNRNSNTIKQFFLNWIDLGTHITHDGRVMLS